MTDVNTVAEPSAATPTHYDSWDEKGNPIVSKKEPAASNAEPPKTQDSAPADPPKEAHSEGKPKSAAEPGAAPKQEKGKATAEERIQQLIAEREAERKERKSLEERLRKLETSPQTTSREEPKAEAKAPEIPKRPNVLTWTGTAEEFDVAMDKYEQWRDQQAVIKYQQEQAARTAQQRTADELKAAKEKYPDAEDKIPTAVKQLLQAELPGVIRAMFDDSEVLTDLLYTLSDETTLNNFLDVARTNPGKAVRALAKMEEDIKASTTKPKAEPAKEVTPVEPKPRAPKPPSEVGGRGAAAVDALKSAAEANDYKSFEAEQNRRAFAR